MLLQCQPGSEIYNQLTKTLDLVGELNQVALDNAHAMASEATTQATSRGARGGGSRGCGCSGGRGGGPDDEDDLVTQFLVVILINTIVFVQMMRRWRPIETRTWMASGHCDARRVATAQASHPVGHDDSAKHTSHAQAHPRSPLPTLLSPPLFSGSTHEGGCIFVPTPGRPTPPVVQVKPTQEPSLPNPDEPAAQIEQIRSEILSRSMGCEDHSALTYIPLVTGLVTAPRTSRASLVKGRAQANAAAQQGLIAYWQSIVNCIDNYLKIMRANHVPPFLVCKLFAQIFSFINVQLFNSLLLRHECCSFNNGEYLKAMMRLRRY
nr:myosin-11 [Quercus suber]